MSGSSRIPGGPAPSIAGTLGTTGSTGSPPARPSASSSQQQPPEGLKASRVASRGELAPRGQGGPGSETPTITTPPLLQRMERRGGAFPAGAPQVPPAPALHAAQHLILRGDIHGTEEASQAEADRRVRQLQDKARSLGGPPVTWRDAVVELRELREETKISENTFVQLANAAHRSDQADQA